MTIAVWVTVNIPKENEDEFLKVMKTDTEESRKEEGCLRFDVIKGEADGVYHFYEVYKNAEAQATHKTLPHYIAWADFKKGIPSIGETQVLVFRALHACLNA